MSPPARDGSQLNLTPSLRIGGASRILNTRRVALLACFLSCLLSARFSNAFEARLLQADMQRAQGTESSVAFSGISSSGKITFDPRNCTLAVSPLQGSHWEYENCVYVGQGGGFILHWTFDRSSGVLDVAIAAHWDGWLAWGVGPRMLGASAIVLLPHEGGYFVSRYFLAGFRPQDNAADTGDLVMANNSIKVHKEGNRLRLFFGIVLPVDVSPHLACVMAKGPGGFGNGTLLPHDPQLSAHTTIRLDAGGAPQWLQNLHGVVNMAAWGLLLPAGVLVARHLRTADSPDSGVWFNAHRSIQALGFLLGAFGFLLGAIMWATGHRGRTRVRGVPLEDTDEGQLDPTGHRVLALLLFLLAAFQATAVMGHPHQEALLRPWWAAVHRWTGRAVVLLALANVWLGMRLIEPHIAVWKYVYAALVAGLALAAVALEAQMLWRWLLEEHPTTPLQRALRSLLPRSVRYHHRLLAEEGEKVDLSDREIEVLATRIQQELSDKTT